jgi:hypothetical protein
LPPARYCARVRRATTDEANGKAFCLQRREGVQNCITSLLQAIRRAVEGEGRPREGEVGGGGDLGGKDRGREREGSGSPREEHRVRRSLPPPPAIGGRVEEVVAREEEVVHREAAPPGGTQQTIPAASASVVSMVGGRGAAGQLRRRREK